MDPFLLKRWGVLFIILGLTIVCVSIYGTFRFSLAVLTELLPGSVAIFIGVYLICAGRKQDPKGVLSFSGSSSGRVSPFYYELEPVFMPQRSLPPIPKDIGRDYDPVVMDRV